MIKTLEIGGKKIKFKATGRTPVYYREIFKEDFFVATDAVVEGTSDTPAYEVWARCGYVMAMQAAKKEEEMTELNYESYLKWLDGFGPKDLATGVFEIMDFWHGDTVPAAEAKKQEG